MKLSCVNVCTVVELDNRFSSLDEVNTKLKNSHPVKSKKFRSIVYKNFNATFLIYKSGKFVSLGSKSVEKARKSAEKLVQELNKRFSSNFKIINFRITNMVGAGCLEHRIRVDHFSTRYPKNCMWEPELFLALYFRFKPKSAVIVSFPSGKFYITGSNQWTEIEELARKFAKIAHEFEAPAKH